MSLHCLSGACVPVHNCSNVTCPAPDDCHGPPVCAAGYPPSERCNVHPAISRLDGSPCNDNDPRTELDTCNTTSPTESTCAGIDFCVRGNVTCPDPPQCFEQPPCLRGLCASPVPTPDVPCDDGLDRTRNDTCDATGACVGIDLCDLPDGGVVSCPDYPCHQSLGCLHGDCLYEALADGAPCDDGDNRTVNDTCVDANSTALGGGCAGVFPDLCLGQGDAHCAAPATCKGPGTCDSITGDCSYPDLPALTPCADGDPRTFGDVCFSGSCVGLSACVGACVSFESTQDIHTGAGFSVTRVKEGPGDWNTGLVSASTIQAESTWVGVSRPQNCLRLALVASSAMGIEVAPLMGSKCGVVGFVVGWRGLSMVFLRVFLRSGLAHGLSVSFPL